MACCCLLALCAFSCSNDDEGLSATQGQVCFQFYRIKTYTLLDLTEINSIKAVVEQNGKRIELPSLKVRGDENIMTSEPATLEAGEYKVVSYCAYDHTGYKIDVLDITLEEDNDFTVQAGKMTDFELPVKVKEIISQNNYFNTLYALCTEVLGEDDSKWPPSWDFEGDAIDESWIGLEFHLDGYGNPTNSISGIIIDGDSVFTYDENGERLLASLPEFKHMKTLPAAVANLSSMLSLTVRNCDLETLPEELGTTNIETLNIENTRLSTLPEGLARSKSLRIVMLKDNAFTVFPSVLCNLNLYMLDIVNERIADLPEGVSNWTDLNALRLYNTDLRELPDAFNSWYKLAMLDVRGNKELATLPESMRDTQVPYNDQLFTDKYLHTVLLDGCGFTEIPEQLQHEGIHVLSLSDNLLTSVSKEAVEKMTALNTLKLDGNALTAFPALTHARLGMLSLVDCGLTRDMIDISGLPSLRPDYLFLTREEYERVMGSTVDTWKNEK